jgi:type I thyroxine 5'-deiodinase
MTFEMVQDPITLEERSKVASTCAEKLNMPMPAVVDRMDDKVNQAYRGWPDRLYLIGKDGKLAYTGGRGPFFFSPAEWEAAIEAELKKIAADAKAKPGDIEKSKVDNLIRRR